MSRAVKTFLSALLIAMLVFSFTGCQEGSSTVENETGNSTQTSTQDTAASTTKEAPEVIEISWLGPHSVDIEDNNPIQKALEEKFNVKIINKKVDVYQKESVNLMINSGEMPDVAYMLDNTSLNPSQLYNNGLTRTIPKKFISQYMPSLKKLLDDNPIGWSYNNCPGKSDEYLSLIGYSEGTKVSNMSYAYRLDWLDKVGIKPNGTVEQLDKDGRLFITTTPFTLEQCEKIFDAFVNKDPDGNTKKDTFGMGGCNYDYWTFNTIAGAFGFSFSDYAKYGGNVNVDKQAVHQMIALQYKEFLKYASKWYKLGYIDPEFPTLTIQKMWEKVNAGQIGCWNGSFDYFDTNTYKTRPPATLLETDKNAKVLLTLPETGADGKTGTYAGLQPFAYNYYINKNVDDKKLIKFLQIMEYVNFDPKASVWVRYGEENVHYTWEGTPWESKPIWKEGVTYGGKEGLSNYMHVYYTKDYLKYLNTSMMNTLSNYFIDYTEKHAVRPYKSDEFTITKYTEIDNKYKADLKTIYDEFYYNALTGRIDVDAEWDNYVKKWLAAGGAELQAELQKMPLTSEFLKAPAK